MITFERVSKRYGEVAALSDLTLELRAGEIFGYIGPNGAGKTTTIKILTGLVRDYQGSVRLDGEPVDRNRTDLHKLIGYLPQEAGFQEWRTVAEVLSTFGRLSGLEGSRLQTRIAQVLHEVDLIEHRNRRVVHLSGGTVQRLRLAQAILHDPQILILDEPLNGLDPASRYQVRTIIRRLADEKRLVFFSSHILSDVETIAGRIAILQGGTLRDVGTPAELRERHGIGTVVEVAVREGAAISTNAPDGCWDADVEHVEQTAPNVIRLQLQPECALDAVMQRLLAKLSREHLPVRRIEHLQPSLEDVYLKLTGSTGRET